MKLSRTLFTLPLLALAAACTSSGADDSDVYAAAVTEGGSDTTLDGVPGDTATPADDDATPTAEERRVHFSCDLPDVRARVEARGCEGGDMSGGGGHGHHGGGTHTSTTGHHEGGTHTSTTGHGRHGHGGGPLAFRRLLWIYDVDDSGDLSDDERAELEADLAVRCDNLQAALLEAFDADLDGTLSDEELTNAQAAYEAERVAREVAELAEFDADGDGQLSHEERRAAHDAKKAALIARFDADASGDLDDTEAAALRAYMRSVVRGEIAPE